MTDAKHAIADVLAGHDHWDYAGALQCRCDMEFEGCVEESVKGWANHLAEMVDAALGGLTRQEREIDYGLGARGTEKRKQVRYTTPWETQP